MFSQMLMGMQTFRFDRSSYLSFSRFLFFFSLPLLRSLVLFLSSVLPVLAYEVMRLGICGKKSPDCMCMRKAEKPRPGGGEREGESKQPFSHADMM
mmetsp:Transcript_12084/g.23320  ORF Transcript_12084/g.23320 Transcript_12084/m.23320 type:complete len:96 (+) Transcript_12084:343-630(+)